MLERVRITPRRAIGIRAGRLSLLPWLAALTCSAFLSTAGAARPELGGRIDAYLKARALRGDFSGDVLVEYKGATVLSGGYGFADFELKVPNDGTRVFRIGSLSKPFTAMAILKLQEEGKLGIDDSVCKYLRDCPTAWGAVHLRHLLSHTSGIPDYFGEVSAGPTSRMREYIDEAVKAHTSSPLSSTPGQVYRYSNFGYLLLGYVCEVAARQPWLEVLRRKIFSPLGMSATGYDDIFHLVPNRAHGYDRVDGTLRNILYKDHGAFAAGGLRSSVVDLLAWQQAFWNGRLLPAALRDEMLTPVRDHYGLGWQVIDLLGRRTANHTGGIDGFASHLVHYRDQDLTIVVLSNISDEPVKTTACDLARIVFDAGDTVLDQPTPTPPPSVDVEALTGTYSDGDITRRIEPDPAGLAYVRGTDRSALISLTATRFRLGRATFLDFDPAGSSFTITDGCGTTVATMKRTPD